MTDYIALIRKEDDTAYGVNVPDFPGFVSGGESLDDAMRRARDGLAFHVEGMIENGETIPEPSTVDQVRADPHNADAVVALVDVPSTKSRAVRVNITINDGLLRRIDAAAAEAGTTRSGFIATAVAAKIGGEADAVFRVTASPKTTSATGRGKT